MDIRSTCSYLTVLLVFICDSALKGVQATCSYPGLLVANATAVENDVKDSYNTGDTLTYSCTDDVSAGMFGTAYVTCKADTTWSDSNRECDDAISIEPGSIAGLCVAASNVLIVVIFIVITSCILKPAVSEGSTDKLNGSV